MQFNETYTAEPGKDIVLAFKLAWFDAGGNDYDNTFSVGNTKINMQAIGAAPDTEHGIKVVATTEGTSVYLDNNNVPVASSSDTSINKISFQAYVNGVDPIRAQCSADDPMGYPVFCFNDMVVYETPDGVLSEVPQAETHEEATAAPTGTPPPTAAPIETETAIDFETTDFETVGIETAYDNNFTEINKISDPEASDNTVLSIEHKPESVTTYSYATFDFGDLTFGKSHVTIDYDLYGTDGRLKVILQDGMLDGGNATMLPDGLIRQGKLSSGTFLNFSLNTWVHTTVDMDFALGTGTYTVRRKHDGALIGAGSIETDIKALTTMSFVPWAADVKQSGDGGVFERVL